MTGNRTAGTAAAARHMTTTTTAGEPRSPGPVLGREKKEET